MAVPGSLAHHLDRLWNNSGWLGIFRYQIPELTDTGPELPLAARVVAGTRIFRGCHVSGGTPYVGSLFFECNGGDPGWEAVRQRRHET